MSELDELDPAAIFRQEASELMETLEIALLDLDRSPDNSALIDTAFRALHTIKGSGAMFGFDRVAGFIHDFETAFDQIRKGRATANPELIKVALDAKDHIRLLIEAPDSVDARDSKGILGRLAATTRAGGSLAAPVVPPDGAPVEAAPVVPPDGAPVEAAPAEAAWHLDFAFDSEALVNGSNPLLMFDELRALGPCRIVANCDGVPSLRKLDPRTLYLSWQVDITTSAPATAFDEVFMFVRDDMRLDVTRMDLPASVVVPTAKLQVEAPKALPESLEQLVAKPSTDDARDAKAKAVRTPAKETSTIRVPAERLDEMMDRVGELVIVQARLSQIAAETGDNVKSVAEDISRLTSALREAMMGIRMVPVGSLFVRFRRLIHDLSRDLGKEIELITVGDETEMDKTMIERLADPLVHIIRNSADHGLEDAATRAAAGKPKTGRIEVVAQHAGTEVLLSIRDDGRGLDAHRIRQKAEEQGLIQPGASLPDSELYPLIFAPGFSTAQEVSTLSGRGVGMDVVKRTIESMRGSIDIATARNEGTTITLRLPLTLAIIEGLLVRVADMRYVIPLVAVEECVELSKTEDARSEGRSFLNIRGDLIPFLRLREMFRDAGRPDVYQKVVIVSNGDGRVGLVVDQIIGSHQTVIKSLSKLHAEVDTFSGATILGDGTVALILDVPHIVTLGQLIESRHMSARMEVAS